MKMPAPRFQLRCTLGQDTAHLRDSLLDRDHTIVLPRPLTREDFEALGSKMMSCLEVSGLAGSDRAVLAMLFKGTSDCKS